MPLLKAQILEVQNIEEDQIVIALKLGNARTIDDFFSLIHVIDLGEYNEHVRRLFDIVESFGEHSTLKNGANISKLKLKALEDKLRTLNPYKRSKRGLIDGL